MFNMTTTHP